MLKPEDIERLSKIFSETGRAALSKVTFGDSSQFSQAYSRLHDIYNAHQKIINSEFISTWLPLIDISNDIFSKLQAQYLSEKEPLSALDSIFTILLNFFQELRGLLIAQDASRSGHMSICIISVLTVLYNAASYSGTPCVLIHGHRVGRTLLIEPATPAAQPAPCLVSVFVGNNGRQGIGGSDEATPLVTIGE
jgi:hypothetical protein